MEFEWDFTKEEESIKKHNVSFVEAMETFSDPQALLLEDDKHSQLEERNYWVGKTAKGRVLTTRFTMRRNKIRIIGSAEWRKFRRLYNEATKSKKS